MGQKIQHLDQLFQRGLQEVLADEQHFIEAIPRFCQAARSQVLIDLLHRIEKTSTAIVKEQQESGSGGSKLKRKAFRSVIEEGERKIKEIVDRHLLDVELVSIIQRLLGFQIASYHSLRLQARLLKRTEITLLCKLAVEEKENALRQLEELAFHQIYWQASWWSPEQNSSWSKFKNFLQEDWDRTKEHLGLSAEEEEPNDELAGLVQEGLIDTATAPHFIIMTENGTKKWKPC